MRAKKALRLLLRFTEFQHRKPLTDYKGVAVNKQTVPVSVFVSLFSWDF